MRTSAKAADDDGLSALFSAGVNSLATMGTALGPLIRTIPRAAPPAAEAIAAIVSSIECMR
jgi:hypothetical protein